MLDLKVRTRELSLCVVRLFADLPRTTEAQILGKQLLRSATSIGAQYRESCRAKSDADFISKIEGSLQEAEETLYWLELLQGLNLIKATQAQAITDDVEEIMRVFVAMVCKVKNRR